MRSLIIGFLFLLAGCNLGSNGTTTVTSTGPAPAIFLLAPNEHASFSMQTRSTESFSPGGATAEPQAVASNCPPGSIGTFSGRDGTPFSSSVEYGVSCTGAYFGIDTSTGILTGLSDGGAVLYDQPGCQGNAYVSPNYSNLGVPSISQAAVDNSAVFRVDPRGLGASDATTYEYIPASEKGDDTVVLVSTYIFGSGCQTVNVGPGITMYPLQPNSIQLSGEGNAPVALPVVTGSGA